MYLIDTTYFTHELNLPNIAEEQIYGAKNNSINSYIDRYVRELLEKALGVTLFDELNKHISDGGLKDTAPKKFKNLINGAVLIKHNKKYIWKGLLIKQGLFKKSLLANYVYCNWLYQNNTMITGIGEVKGDAVNTTNVNSTERFVKIWNDFIKMYQGVNKEFSIFNSQFSIRNGIPFTDYYRQNQEDSNLSLVDFLKMSDDFKNVNPYMFEVKNYLGI